MNIFKMAVFVKIIVFIVSIVNFVHVIDHLAWHLPSLCICSDRLFRFSFCLWNNVWADLHSQYKTVPTTLPHNINPQVSGIVGIRLSPQHYPTDVWHNQCAHIAPQVSGAVSDRQKAVGPISCHYCDLEAWPWVLGLFLLCASGRGLATEADCRLQ